MAFASKRGFPIMLTFDVDAETFWTSKDPKSLERPVILSQGQYGPRTGVPRILEFLDRHGIRATFFMPGQTVERYPEMTRDIQARGHEIAHHSYDHVSPETFTTAGEERSMMERVSGII
jgi:peptidoglycan/xylan/chitin deacetylase (PgdA/CDA1 family)